MYLAGSIFKGENHVILWKNSVFIGLHTDASEPVSLKFGVIIDSIKLYIMIMVWMIFTQI